MGLDSAQLKAINDAQMASDLDKGAAGSIFAKAFDEQYQKQVQKKKEEKEKLEKVKDESIADFEKLSQLGSSLGTFKDLGADYLKGIEDKLYATWDIESKFEREKQQNEILSAMEEDMKPFAEVNSYLTSLKEANSKYETGGISTQHKDEIITIGGKEYNKYDLFQAIGLNGKAHSMNQVSTILNGEEVIINFDELKSDEFKVSYLDGAEIDTHFRIINDFTSKARMGNMTKQQVEVMANDFLNNMGEEWTRNMAYNYYQFDGSMDDEARRKALGDGMIDMRGFVKDRMVEKIRAGYVQKEDKPDEQTLTEGRIAVFTDAATTPIAARDLISNRLPDASEFQDTQLPMPSGAEGGTVRFKTTDMEGRETWTPYYNLADEKQRKQAMEITARILYGDRGGAQIGDTLFGRKK